MATPALSAHRAAPRSASPASAPGRADCAPADTIASVLPPLAFAATNHRTHTPDAVVASFPPHTSAVPYSENWSTRAPLRSGRAAVLDNSHRCKPTPLGGLLTAAAAASVPTSVGAAIEPPAAMSRVPAVAGRSSSKTATGANKFAVSPSSRAVGRAPWPVVPKGFSGTTEKQRNRRHLPCIKHICY